ncbi:hypothetical protein BIV57_00290 [Mangrovactinospora gilvigrisea]|uniref:Uncharacterized protein n=1 Tax=Mangrovactinospora gilvigrisea TaxID=1428644 RepID=A0A1J7CCQ2_9ACTN|nr:hypothetical protein BIV57_00290 [Mangrovactinospora gilvigrisea]
MRPAYDPGRFTLAEREQAKAEELTASGFEQVSRATPGLSQTGLVGAGGPSQRSYREASCPWLSQLRFWVPSVVVMAVVSPEASYW